MAGRIVLHLDMDAFFAAVEERENPRFRGKPVVVGADPKEGRGRGVVSTANYEARKYGVRSAMPISEAYRLCPHAVFLPVNGKLYKEVSEHIMRIVAETFPGCPLEQVSLDEVYVDLSEACDSRNHTAVRGDMWEKAQELARKLKQRIWEREKLKCTIGIGPNKMVAKIACEKAKPNGLLVVLPEEVEDFLAPLPIRDIPGVGPRTESTLIQFYHMIELNQGGGSRTTGSRTTGSRTTGSRTTGSRTMGDVRRIPHERLRNAFGRRGEQLYWQVRGQDDSPVVPEAERTVKSIGREHTFERDTRAPDEIFPVFDVLVKETMEELKRGGFSCKTVTVVCRFSGFETHTKSRTLGENGNAGKTAKNLLLRFLVEQSKPVRLIGVRLKVVPAL